MRTASKQALVCWFGGMALVVAAMYAAYGPPATSEGASESIGRVFAHSGMAALFTWLIARKKEPAWSWLKFGGVWLVWVVVLAIVTTAGKARAAGHGDHSNDTVGDAPLHVAWPPEWEVSRLPGVSSDARDRDAGVREVGVRKTDDGAAALVFSCSWLTATSPNPDLEHELRQIANGLEQGLEQAGRTVERAVLRSTKLGVLDARAVSVHSAAEPALALDLVVAKSPSCFVNSTYTGSGTAYEAFRADAEKIRASATFD